MGSKKQRISPAESEHILRVAKKTEAITECSQKIKTFGDIYRVAPEYGNAIGEQNVTKVLQHIARKYPDDQYIWPGHLPIIMKQVRELASMEFPEHAQTQERMNVVHSCNQLVTYIGDPNL